jgi:hypothetical protein
MDSIQNKHSNFDRNLGNKVIHYGHLSVDTKYDNHITNYNAGVVGDALFQTQNNLSHQNHHNLQERNHSGVPLHHKFDYANFKNRITDEVQTYSVDN